ncbi:MAG: TetR/AcrR family transcriptional regulator [Bdellovibrionaceae bacterium]|nr:TetR/AcrR family transcriptional regulator [Pseudobdellovibrionaceae bacterium]MBX3032577.1 TetR/AcrR family transcriptional regulator [Pseudobdellovibrionaceae bacterium]
MAGPLGAESKPKKKKTKIQVKAPTQERSRQTVATILEACSKILIREGFFGVTTDKIAKEAGVSIGSLYQFFGNKESVVSAVIHNMFKTDQDYILARTKELDALQTVEEKVRRLIDIGVEVYRRNAELRSKLQNIQTYLTDESFYQTTMKSYQELVLRYLPVNPGRDPQRVAYILVTTFVGLMDRAILEMGDISQDKAFMDETYRLFTNYITK